MARWGELTPATILEIAYEARQGKADPDDARRVIEMFCASADSNFPPELIGHLQASFREYLSGGKTLEAALGLVRKKGRPDANENVRQSMAAAVLRNRLDGMTHESSIAAVSDEFGWGESIIKEAWADNKQIALTLLRLERAEDGSHWTENERERLTKIFAKEPWFTPPEKSPIKPA